MIRWYVKERFQQLKSLIWMILPASICKYLYKHYENKRNRNRMEIFLHTNISNQHIKDAFAKLNIYGDVKIHSSLIDIGNIQGKHRIIMKCLNELVIERGHTLLSVAIPIKGSSYDFLSSIKSFDRNAPIAMGVLSKCCATLPTSFRSLEPTHSVVAIGPDAKYYTENHHIDTTPFGIHSPYFKLLEKNGSVLLIGAGIKHLTLCHLIEDLLGDDFPVKVYDKKMFDVDIYQNDKLIYKGKYKAHNKFISCLRVSGYVHNQILHLQSTQIVPLGASNLICINARDAVICMLNELKKGNSIYGHCCVSKRCKQKIDELLLKDYLQHVDI